MTSVAAAKCEDAQICSEHAAAAEESALAARVANLRKTLSDATEAGSRLGTARAEGQAAFERVLSDCSARVAAQKAAADAFAQRLSAARQTAAGTQRELDAVRRTQRVAALRDEEVACTGRDESCAGAKQLSEQNVRAFFYVWLDRRIWFPATHCISHTGQAAPKASLGAVCTAGNCVGTEGHGCVPVG